VVHLKTQAQERVIERFKNLRWKEVHVKYENSRLYVSIVFEFRYEPYVPRGIIALDINMRTITTYDGSKVRRFRTRFVDALSKRRRAEKLQRKYSERWRFNEKILSRVKALHRRARNIVIDWCWKFSKQIVPKALKHGYAMALEDLKGLRENANSKSDEITWKFIMFE